MGRRRSATSEGRRGRRFPGGLAIAVLLALVGHHVLMVEDVHAGSVEPPSWGTDAAPSGPTPHDRMHAVDASRTSGLAAAGVEVGRSREPGDRQVPGCGPGWSVVPAPQRDNLLDGDAVLGAIDPIAPPLDRGAAVERRSSPTVASAIRRALLQVYRI